MACHGCLSISSVLLFVLSFCLLFHEITAIVDGTRKPRPERHPLDYPFVDVEEPTNHAPGTITGMGPCSKDYDPVGEVSNCECYTPPLEWPQPDHSKLQSLKENTISQACSQVSGTDIVYGHSPANYSMEGRSDRHRLTVRNNRDADACKDSKTLSRQDCIARAKRATDCSDPRQGGFGGGQCLTFDLKFFAYPASRKRNALVPLQDEWEQDEKNDDHSEPPALTKRANAPNRGSLTGLHANGSCIGLEDRSPAGEAFNCGYSAERRNNELTWLTKEIKDQLIQQACGNFSGATYGRKGLKDGDVFFLNGRDRILIHYNNDAEVCQEPKTLNANECVGNVTTALDT
ncbi:hypothetical protein Q7P37_000356 [Cladosporium fusiforme]